MDIMETPKEEKQEEKTSAEKYYEKHLENVRKYQREHKVEMRAKCKDYQKRLKEERPEDYALYLERKRQYYNDVLKPKRALNKKKQLLQLVVSVATD